MTRYRILFLQGYLLRSCFATNVVHEKEAQKQVSSSGVKKVKAATKTLKNSNKQQHTHLRGSEVV
jgi:hypothetical protein